MNELYYRGERLVDLMAKHGIEVTPESVAEMVAGLIEIDDEYAQNDDRFVLPLSSTRS
jgi:hypothetical protein